MLKKIPAVVLPLLTSVLLVLAYPKFNLGWVAWVALGPLAYYLLKVKSRRAAAAGGLACGAAFYAGILYWIYPTMRAGGVEPWLSALGLALLSLLMALEFVLISVYGQYIKKTGGALWPYLFALGWFVLEYGKVRLAFRAVWFPWFMLGYTQWDYKPLIQIASVTGVYGLSAAVCFTGALLGSALAAPLPPLRRALRLLPAAVVIAGLYFYGRSELQEAAALKPARTLRVALLQPSIDQYAKWDLAQAESIKAEMVQLAAQAKGADLAVWPENALPCWLNEPACAAWLKVAVSSTAAASVVGSVSKEDGKRVSAFLLDANGGIVDSYNKRQLVPFGEYVPMRGLLGRYVQPVAALGEFLPGAPYQPLMRFNGLKLGAAICYESVFPYLFTDDTAQGADLFVNVTNDGWYLDTGAPYQHFAANIFRAVENRRTVVRAANNGISGVIDPWGRVLARTALNERAALAADAPVYKVDAVFPENGRWFAFGAALIVSAFLLAVIFL